MGYSYQGNLSIVMRTILKHLEKTAGKHIVKQPRNWTFSSVIFARLQLVDSGIEIPFTTAANGASPEQNKQMQSVISMWNSSGDKKWFTHIS